MSRLVAALLLAAVTATAVGSVARARTEGRVPFAPVLAGFVDAGVGPDAGPGETRPDPRPRDAAPVETA